MDCDKKGIRTIITRTAGWGSHLFPVYRQEVAGEDCGSRRPDPAKYRFHEK